MGWMRALFLGDIGNQLDIADNRRDMEHVRDSLRRSAHHQLSIDAEQSERIAELRAEVEDLQLAVASLARLLVKGGALSEADLEGIVNRLDS